MTTYKIALFAFVITALIYIHDAFPKNIGTIGLSSVRVYLYTVFAEIRFLAALLFIFHLAKGYKWRFVWVLPILLTTYQAIIRLFALQKTGYNEITTKVFITILISIFITIYYFKSKQDEL